MSRPTRQDSESRRARFARLIADDLYNGGLELARRNVVDHRLACRLDPNRALRLQFDPSFVSEVERLARPELREQ